MTARILVINPNSNESVTRGMDRALRSRRADKGADVTFRTMEEGPFGIESEDDIAAVIPLIVREIESNDDFDAFVIACYSDPGLSESRAVSAKPVLGIHESAVSLAVAHGRRFGVLALSRDSIQRHIAYVRQLGYQSFHAGERPLDISVDEAANDPRVLQKIIDTGRELVAEDGAEILILGCAGMANHSRAAQRDIGVPVIDPTSAAVTLAAESLQG